MGKISLEVRDEELLQLGEVRLKEEIEYTLKCMKVKGLLRSISSALSSLKLDYEREIEGIKEDAWRDYKKEIHL